MQKIIGPTFINEINAAGCPELQWGADGLIECHVLTSGVYYLVKITCEVGGTAVETRIAEIVGTYPCITEAQLTTVKACLTAHDPGSALNQLIAIQSQRAAAYPPIGDQLDSLWHSMDNGTTTKIEPFYSDIKAVKDQYPKP